MSTVKVDYHSSFKLDENQQSRNCPKH